MSRPTTRSKNKKQRQDVDADRNADMLRKIHVSSEITDENINQLYNIWKPVCQGCRVNNKENPNCFCGLVPSVGGSRKVGLWMKQSEFQQGLGPDPSEDLRSSLKFPSGLTNLGATCYANSILQCLFMNTSFRKGVFSIEDDLLKQQPVLDQLAWLFVQLQASMKAFIDSAPFIKTLELDNGVQQDSHEFLTLLLSLLERCLSNSRSSAAKTIVQDLFRGNVSHVTTCSKCGRDSEASSKIEDFYELELNVMGLKTLAESLDDYLSIEELNGDNQYFCDSCQTRVDATRSIKLRSLPDVLNIQLKRCVFLPKTTMKKKITSAFSFPRELDMWKRLSDPAQADLVYDLSAVLIHKGTAVNSGHYIAHIKDENTGQWWEFDDEVVSKLGFHPFGEGSSKSGNKQTQKEVPVTVPSSQLVSNDAKAKVADAQFLETASSDSETFSSNDAYMLMYTLRHRKINGQKRTSDSKSDIDFACLSNGTSLPSCLGEKIKELNCSYVSSRNEYNLRKEKEWGHILKRREEVREILSEAPVQSSGEPYFWISMNWLRHWADDIVPQILDNTPIQCEHGKVPVSNIGSMKRVSATAWTKLFSKYDGRPALSNSDDCRDCLIDAARNLVCAESYRDRRKFMKEIAESVLSGNCSDGTYCVSKAWLQQWVKRKIMDAPTEADVGPTVSICCPHGLLRPEQAAGAKRVLVPENLWLFFYGDSRTVKPDDETSLPTFLIDSKQCSECSDELSEVASLEDSLRAIKNKQRQNHEKLAAGKSIPLFPDCKYYLLPSAWLAKWRNYVLASGKNVSASMEPDVLDSVIDQLKCKKHLNLLEKPLDLVYKRGAIMQKVSNTDGLTIITEKDWKCFCEEWGCTEQNGISAIIEFADIITPEDNKGGISSCKDTPMSVSEDESNSHEGANDKCDDKPPPVIRTSPEVCEECIGERASCQLMQRLNYSNQDIYVALVQGKEVPKSILEASDTSFDPDRRTSKRSRKSSHGSAINLKVSGSTSLYQLKMMIWESLGVVKENQIIHKGHLTIEGDDSTTLADYNIFPGDTLWVRDTKVHEHRDIADELSDPAMEVQHSGGFRGTLLAADFQPQIV